MIGAIIPAAASLAGTLISNSVNARNVEKSNQQNEALQREQWARDDTAYQRTVADMEKAGLNPLAGVNPQSSPLSVQNQAAEFQNPLADLPSILQTQAQLNFQEKGLALQAIRSGVNPNSLDNFADNDLLNDYKNLIKYQAQELKKAAGSRNSRNTGIFGKVFGDVRDNLPGSVNDTLDNVLDSAGNITQNYYNNAKKSFGEVKEKIKKLPGKLKKKIDDFQAKQNEKKVKRAMGQH